MYLHKYSFRVRYAEVDRMKIVYHSNYIIWLELGRTEFLRSLGYTYSDMEEEGIWLPVVQADVKYKFPAFYDDEVTVETRIDELGKAKITFGYRIFCGDRLLSEGFTVHAFTNDDLRPMALQKHKPELYKVLQDCLD